MLLADRDVAHNVFGYQALVLFQRQRRSAIWGCAHSSKPISICELSSSPTVAPSAEERGGDPEIVDLEKYPVVGVSPLFPGEKR